MAVENLRELSITIGARAEQFKRDMAAAQAAVEAHARQAAPLREAMKRLEADLPRIRAQGRRFAKPWRWRHEFTRRSQCKCFSSTLTRLERGADVKS